MTSNPKLTFFAKVPDKKLLQIMQWYANDIEILKSIDPDLNIATSMKEISWQSDVYFSWFVTGSIFPFIIAKLKKKPIIVIAGGSEVVRSIKMLSAYSSKSIIEKCIINIVLKHADRILTVSNELKKEVASFGIKDSMTIHHGIKTDVYKPSKTLKDIIFTISHLDKYNVERKRIKTIINSIPYIIKKFPTQKFVIAGSKGDAFEDLVNLVQSLRIEDNVFFPGRITNKQKLEYFMRSKIYLQPTIHEAFGVAIAEAMSCGIPVISCANTAVPEVLGDKGIYVNPDNPKNLAQSAIALLNDDDNREQIGMNLRQRVIDNFSFELRKKEIINLVKTFIE